MLENIAFFPTKREKDHPIINIESGGGENLLCVPTLLSGIVSKKNLTNVTPFALAKVGNEGSCTVSRVQLTRVTKEKQHAMASFTWVGIKKRKVIFLNDLLR